MPFLQNLRWLASKPFALGGHTLDFVSQAAPLAGGIGGGLAGGAAGGIGAAPGAALGAKLGTLATAPVSWLGNLSHRLAREIYDPAEANIQNQIAQQPAVAGQMMPQGQQPVSAMPTSPERQAYNQLLGDWSNFNAQPYIQEAMGRYQQEIVPQIAERFAGAGQRGSAFRNALARGGQGFARGLQSDIWQQQQQQRTMLANLLAGQQAAQQQNLALALQGYGQQGQLGLQAGQLGLQRAASPVQAGLQASGIGLGQMQTPYMQQGQPGWLPQVLSGLGQAAGLGTQMYRTAKGL